MLADSLTFRLPIFVFSHAYMHGCFCSHVMAAGLNLIYIVGPIFNVLSFWDNWFPNMVSEMLFDQGDFYSSLCSLLLFACVRPTYWLGPFFIQVGASLIYIVGGTF